MTDLNELLAKIDTRIGLAGKRDAAPEFILGLRTARRIVSEAVETPEPCPLCGATVPRLSMNFGRQCPLCAQRIWEAARRSGVKVAPSGTVTDGAVSNSVSHHHFPAPKPHPQSPAAARHILDFSHDEPWDYETNAPIGTAE